MEIEIKRKRRMRKIRKDSKFDYKYVRQLAGGIRYKKGLAIAELCRMWRITMATYYKWVEKYPDFSYAHEQGQVDFAAWMHQNFKGIMTGETKGNAQAAIFSMTNVPHIQWSNRVDVHTTQDEEVKTIKIELLQPRQLEVIEGQVIKDNILQLVKHESE